MLHFLPFNILLLKKKKKSKTTGKIPQIMFIVYFILKNPVMPYFSAETQNSLSF